jgi:hypothetical protein
MQVSDNGNWVTASRSNGEAVQGFYEMHLEYEFASGTHQWEVEFEAPLDWPVGSYRIAVNGTAFVAGEQAYSITSNQFAVSPADNLVIAVTEEASGEAVASFSYQARPNNYRVIDPQSRVDELQPVRTGQLSFVGSSTVTADTAAIALQGRRFVALYTANVSGISRVDGVDAYGNTGSLVIGESHTEEQSAAQTGLLGIVAALGADLNVFITAMANGDYEAAQAAVSEALSNAQTNGEDSLAGDDASVSQTIQDSFVHQDPVKFMDDIAALLGTDDGAEGTGTALLTAARDVEPVVLTGADIPAWSQASAEGTAYPYPAGAGFDNYYEDLSGGGFGIEDFIGPVAGVYPINGRSAHNGEFIYPPAYNIATNEPKNPLGVRVEEIIAYRVANSDDITAGAAPNSMVEIPVQVDERFPHFLANGRSTFAIYSGTDEELSYAWDTDNWEAADLPAGFDGDAHYPAGEQATKDPIGGLDNDDEIVFMASDAGACTTNPQAPEIAGVSAIQQVVINDPLAPNSQTCVYLGLAESGSTIGDRHYVNYLRNADADQWIDRNAFCNEDPQKLGTSNGSYGANLHGKTSLKATDCGSFPNHSYQEDTLVGFDSTDRFPRDGVVVSTDTYRWEASGRWMIRDIRMKAEADDVSQVPDVEAYWDGRPDLIDRWKGRAFQQSPDSGISLVGFEDEQVNWEANASLIGERCGPVRCIREVWGADSGTNVTKTETFYRDAITYRYRVRVHPIPADGLYTSWDYNRGAMVTNEADPEGTEPGRYYTALRPQGVYIDGVNDDFGQVDNLPGCHSITAALGTEMGDQSVLGGYDQLRRQFEDNGGNNIPFVGFPSREELERCLAFFDVADPTFNAPLGVMNWEQIAGKGDSGSLVYLFELKGATSVANGAIIPYYRDDACLDDGTGDDPVQRPWPGDRLGSERVQKAYLDAAGVAYSQANFADQFAELSCEKRQGAYAAHGIHMLVLPESDNAFTPVTSTEVDGMQWQFMVPTDQPRNIADPYANIVKIPLIKSVIPLGVPNADQRGSESIL